MEFVFLLGVVCFIFFLLVISHLLPTLPMKVI